MENFALTLENYFILANDWPHRNSTSLCLGDPFSGATQISGSKPIHYPHMEKHMRIWENISVSCFPVTTWVHFIYKGRKVPYPKMICVTSRNWETRTSPQSQLDDPWASSFLSVLGRKRWQNFFWKTLRRKLQGLLSENQRWMEGGKKCLLFILPSVTLNKKILNKIASYKFCHHLI